MPTAPVNAAGAARGGEALVSPTAKFAFDLPRIVELTGIDGPHLVYPLDCAA